MGAAAATASTDAAAASTDVAGTSQAAVSGQLAEVRASLAEAERQRGAAEDGCREARRERDAALAEAAVLRSQLAPPLLSPGMAPPHKSPTLSPVRIFLVAVLARRIASCDIYCLLGV